MQEIKLFVLQGCSYCHRAREMIDAILAEHPEYAKVPLTVIDEWQQPDIADKYDYYYVPSIFIGDEKLMEGPPSRKAIEAAFAKAAAPERGGGSRQ